MKSPLASSGKSPRLRMSDTLRPTIRRMGRDANPVLIVDDFLANPEEVRQIALASRFRRGDTMRYYPGYQADCALPGIDEIVSWVARRMWHDGFGRKVSGPIIDGADADRPLFSAFSPHPRGKYLSIHVDGHSWLAILLYLSTGMERGTGTAFWRQREHELESVYNGKNPMKTMSLIDGIFGTSMLEQTLKPLGPAPESTFDDFINTLPERDVRPPFSDKDHGSWKRLGIVPFRFNRLVAYPTWMWHSVAMSGAYEPPQSLEAARLTLNVFVRHPLLEPRTLVPIAKIPRVTAR